MSLLLQQFQIKIYQKNRRDREREKKGPHWGRQKAVSVNKCQHELRTGKSDATELGQQLPSVSNRII